MNIKKFCTELHFLSRIHNIDLNDLIQKKVDVSIEYNYNRLMNSNIKNNFSTVLNYFELSSLLIDDLDEEILKKFRLTEKEYSELHLTMPEEVIVTVIVIKASYYSDYGDDYNFSPLVNELNNYLKEYNSYNEAIIIYEEYKNTYLKSSDEIIDMYEYNYIPSDNNEEKIIYSKNIKSTQFYLTCYVLNKLLFEVRSRLKKASILRNEYGQFEFNKPQCVLGLLLSEIYNTPNLIEENSSKIEFVRKTVSIFDVIGKHNFNLYKFKDRENEREELVNSLKGGLSTEKKCKKTIAELADGEYEEIKEALINILKEKAIIKSEKKKK